VQTLQWILAAITAGFVGVVAFLQWLTAQQKAVLDLFEQRRLIYNVVRYAVSTMASNPSSFDQRREAELMDAMERAYFFFGDDVVRYLDLLWNYIIDVRTADTELGGPVDAESRAEILTRQREAKNGITRFYAEGKPAFARYMRFAQTVPTMPWDRLRS
jgi:hypothetical protein